MLVIYHLLLGKLIHYTGELKQTEPQVCNLYCIVWIILKT